MSAYSERALYLIRSISFSEVKMQEAQQAVLESAETTRSARTKPVFGQGGIAGRPKLSQPIINSQSSNCPCCRSASKVPFKNYRRDNESEIVNRLVPLKAELRRVGFLV